MTLTELLPSIRQLSAIEKRELIRILMKEEDITEDIFLLEPYNPHSADLVRRNRTFHEFPALKYPSSIIK
jgi:hypothetical protein